MKNIILSLALLVSSNVFSQISINIEQTQQVFHIDGKNNTTSVPTVIEQEDDFVVTPEGKVGVGTVNPEHNLQVKGEISFPDVVNTRVEGPYSSLVVDQNTGKLEAIIPSSQPLLIRKTAVARSASSWSNLNTRVEMPINTSATNAINTLGVTAGTDAGREYIQIPKAGTYRVEISSMYYSCIGSVVGSHRVYLDIEKSSESDTNWTVIDSPQVYTMTAGVNLINAAYPVESIIYNLDFEEGDRVAFRMRSDVVNSSTTCGFAKPITSTNSIVLVITKI